MGAARGGRASIHLQWGRVRSLDAERPGAIELSVDVDGAAAPAIAYPDLVGEARAGDRVLLNSTARDLGLGTGGVHLVVAVDREPPAVRHLGRVMKARYLPHQVAVRSIEETDGAALEG